MNRPQRLARNAERLTVERNHGRAAPQSGSGDKVKGDSRNETWLFEDKSTSGRTYSLSLATLNDTEKHALADGRRMAVVVTFFSGLANPGPPKRYVLITEDDFLEREQELAELRDTYTRWSEGGMP